MGTSTTDIHRDLAVTSIRIERDKLEQFRDIAASERRTVSQQLRWLVDRYIADALDEKEAA